MNGPQLITELARTMPGLKVVFVSGYADDAFKDDLPPGVNYAFLPKPFGLKDLIEAVQKQLPR
jgi:two-component system cell cycle sensor histidine kinase/response regulator CckA